MGDCGCERTRSNQRFRGWAVETMKHVGLRSELRVAASPVRDVGLALALLSCHIMRSIDSGRTV
jgi:hypothetical protein